MTGRVATTHAGSLPRPDNLLELNRARQAGEAPDDATYETHLRAAVIEVVRRQREIGIDVPGDGEYGKAMGQRVNYGAWWSYSFQRLGGLTLGTELYRLPPRRSDPGEVRLTSFSDRRTASASRLPTPIRTRGSRPIQAAAPGCAFPSASRR